MTATAPGVDRGMGRRGAAALGLLAASFFGGPAEAKSAATYDIISAKANCASRDGHGYAVAFDNTSTRLKLSGADGRTAEYVIGAVIQLGRTIVVVALPGEGSEVTGTYFFGATNKAVFYGRGGMLMNEDTCELLESETARAVAAPKEVVQ